MHDFKTYYSAAPIISYFKKFAAKHVNCETFQSLDVRWWKGVVYCGKELSVAAQDRSIGMDCQNRLLLNTMSGKSSVTCSSHLHFIVFETKSTVRAPYTPPE